MPPTTPCHLVVLAGEPDGRWSDTCVWLIRKLADHRCKDSPKRLPQNWSSARERSRERQKLRWHLRRPLPRQSLGMPVRGWMLPATASRRCPPRVLQRVAPRGSEVAPHQLLRDSSGMDRRPAVPLDASRMRSLGSPTVPPPVDRTGPLPMVLAARPKAALRADPFPPETPLARSPEVRHPMSPTAAAADTVALIPPSSRSRRHSGAR